MFSNRLPLERLSRAIDLAYDLADPALKSLLSQYLHTSTKVSDLLEWTTDQSIKIRKLQSDIAVFSKPHRSCILTCTKVLQKMSIVDKEVFTILEERERSCSATAAE